jgi:regulator of protease activity HflC (stomatin/prohibitin superfamily)
MRPDLVVLRVSSVGVALLVISLAAGAGLAALLNNVAPLLVFGLVGVYLLFAIRKADQWEKVAVLRFGKYIGLRGPGMFHVIPVVDTLSRYVDQRVRVANVSAESTLTRDTVPVNVDAIVFWMVWNAEKSILEVQDFAQAIEFSAQTALRESIGRHELHQMVAERELMGKELQRILDEKTTGWGSRCSRWRFAMCRFRRHCRMRCRGRRRRNANGARASFWARRRRRSRRSSDRRR